MDHSSRKPVLESGNGDSMVPSSNIDGLSSGIFMAASIWTFVHCFLLLAMYNNTKGDQKDCVITSTHKNVLHYDCLQLLLVIMMMLWIGYTKNMLYLMESIKHSVMAKINQLATCLL